PLDVTRGEAAGPVGVGAQLRRRVRGVGTHLPRRTRCSGDEPESRVEGCEDPPGRDGTLGPCCSLVPRMVAGPWPEQHETTEQQRESLVVDLPGGERFGVAAARGGPEVE